MLENQSLGWTKLKRKGEDVQTKDQVEAEMIEKQRAAEATQR